MRMSPEEEFTLSKFWKIWQLKFWSLRLGELQNFDCSSNSVHSQFLNFILFLSPDFGCSEPQQCPGTSHKVLDLRDIPWLQVNLSSFCPLRIQSFSIRRCPQILHEEGWKKSISFSSPLFISSSLHGCILYMYKIMQDIQYTKYYYLSHIPSLS